MNWVELFYTQEKLDQYIAKNNDLQKEDLFDGKILAFLVELGELANETRCFKFWSQQERSPKKDILEEYVDGLHFILSLGLEEGFRYSHDKIERTSFNESEQFIQVFSNGISFRKNRNLESYEKLFTSFLQLGETLGFNEQEIQEAYKEKNQINFQRQDEGY